MNAAAANAVCVKNTQLAASLAALGFPCDCKPLVDVDTEKTAREFLFQSRSLRPEFAHLSIQIAKQWSDGTLARSDPMHPLCVMMHAQHNYNRILDMHHGAIMNLRGTAGGRLTIYRRDTQLDPLTKFAVKDQSGHDIRLECPDLALAAALGLVGLPVLDFDGNEGSRRYWLPRHGYTILTAEGQRRLEDAAQLARRAPTAADERRLALEVTDPLHPVCLGYDALVSRAALKKLLETRDPFLHIRSGGNEVIVSAAHTGRVMDEVAQRIGAPSLHF